MSTWSSGPSRRGRVEAKTSALAQGARQRGLTDPDRLTPQVRAVQLQQVEDVQEGPRLVPPVAEQLEGSHSLRITTHHLAVDQAGARFEPVHRLDDGRIPRKSSPTRAARPTSPSCPPPQRRVRLDFIFRLSTGLTPSATSVCDREAFAPRSSPPSQGERHE
jgi:hypothetical protein